MKRLIALMLVLLTLVSVLAACNANTDTPDGVGENTNDSASDTTAATPDATNPPETESPVPPEPDFVMTAENKYRIVYSDEYANLGASNPYVKRIMQFSAAIKNATGIQFLRGTDFSKTGIYDSDTVEILVGNTNYAETEKIFPHLTYSNFVISVEGNKLVIGGYSEAVLDAAMTKAAELVASCTKDGVVTIPADTFIVESIDGNGYDIPVYTAGRFETTYVSGGDGMMYIFRETTEQDLSDYLKVLQTAGYTEYTTNTINGNVFATYTNSDCTISAGYYAFENTVRIIAEPLAKPVGLASDVKYTAVTTPSITILGCGYTKPDGSTSHTGLSMIIRLVDGSFIIVDGGHGRNEKADQLLKALKELSKDYRKSGEKIRIADWIVTHPHDDHYYMLLDHHKPLLAECTVDRIVANIISDEERNVAMATYPDSRQNNTCARWADLYKVADAFGTYVQFVRTGQVLYRPGIKMEVLYTIDAFAPRVCNAVNTTSLVIKMTFDDGSTFMMTGDATGNAMETCAKLYGDYLKSDVLQVSHHGSSTWSNDNGVAMAYRLIAPTTLLWPSTQNFYNTSRNYGYNAVLFSKVTNSKGENSNFKEAYIAGLEYNACTTPIPYKTGSTYKWKIS